MQLSASKNKIIALGALLLGAVIIIAVLATNRKTAPLPTDDVSVAETPSAKRGFTFLELDGDTVFSKTLRTQLADRLGSDAIENRAVLDLNTNLQGLIQAHLAPLAQLHLELNTPRGERVEHNITRLTYRHASANQTSFDLVQIFFSNFSGRPLLIKVRSHSDAKALPAILERKYGSPRRILWQNHDQNAYVDNARAYIWSTAAQYLVLTEFADRLGNLQYQIFFYYLDALRSLVATEKAQKQPRSQSQIPGGEF